MAILCHQRAAWADPGYMPNNIEPPNHMEGFKIDEKCSKDECRKMSTWKAPRTHHCPDCQRCVFKVSSITRFHDRSDVAPLQLDQQLCGPPQRQILLPVPTLHHICQLLPRSAHGDHVFPATVRAQAQGPHEPPELPQSVPGLHRRLRDRPPLRLLLLLDLP